MLHQRPVPVEQPVCSYVCQPCRPGSAGACSRELDGWAQLWSVQPMQSNRLMQKGPSMSTGHPCMNTRHCNTQHGSCSILTLQLLSRKPSVSGGCAWAQAWACAGKRCAVQHAGGWRVACIVTAADCAGRQTPGPCCMACTRQQSAAQRLQFKSCLSFCTLVLSLTAGPGCVQPPGLR